MLTASVSSMPTRCNSVSSIMGGAMLQSAVETLAVAITVNKSVGSVARVVQEKFNWRLNIRILLRI